MPNLKAFGQTVMTYCKDGALKYEKHRYHGTKVFVKHKRGGLQHIGYIKEAEVDDPERREFVLFGVDANPLSGCPAANSFAKASSKMASRHNESS
jgi:hypothetical protein